MVYLKDPALLLKADKPEHCVINLNLIGGYFFRQDGVSNRVLRGSGRRKIPIWEKTKAYR